VRGGDDCVVRYQIIGTGVAARIRSAVEELARQLERSGAVVEEAPLPELDFSQDLASAGELVGIMIGAFQPGGQSHQRSRNFSPRCRSVTDPLWPGSGFSKGATPCCARPPW
jgi:Asp-tRNA(Asn)/Glu-tRNA(Gln) amidotransferase A subunit family amidase